MQFTPCLCLALLLSSAAIALDDGIYRIEVSGTPLKANDLPWCGSPVDGLVSTRDQFPDDYQLFNLSSIGDGVFRNLRESRPA